MTALRRIQAWVPLLQRPRTHTHRCQRAASRALLLHHRAPHPAAAVTSSQPASKFREFALSASRLRDTDDFSGGHHTGFTEEEEDDEDFIDEREVEELFQQQAPAGIGEGQHRVFIVHPDVKWGSRKQHLTTGKKTSVQVCVCV